MVIDNIVERYNVSRKLLKAGLLLKPSINYTSQELVCLSNENNYPVYQPENDDNMFLILLASRLRGVGSDFIITRSRFYRSVKFTWADDLWNMYISTLFDGIKPRRLYINNKRIDFLSFNAVGNTISFFTDYKYPEQAEKNIPAEYSIFINGDIYNVCKVVVDKGDNLFLWTTL